MATKKCRTLRKLEILNLRQNKHQLSGKISDFRKDSRETFRRTLSSKFVVMKSGKNHIKFIITSLAYACGSLVFNVLKFMTASVRE